MTLPIFATLLLAGMAPVHSQLGWLVRTGTRCFCKLPADPEAALIVAAGFVAPQDRGEA